MQAETNTEHRTKEEKGKGKERRETEIRGKDQQKNGALSLGLGPYHSSDHLRFTTSPHLFIFGDAEEAFIRVRNKVKMPLYGCDCYAYALLSSGFVDLVVESSLKPYDFLHIYHIPSLLFFGAAFTAALTLVYFPESSLATTLFFA
ncbi:hypothetical protein VNO77_11628 [Canavalia gladiata]|uniref:Uncharacterized protein n=1 Tax=Canavalia gladiata TaxID=3824 RepID=A0AAN9MBZ3_CANGL